jgi:iron complex outermembrane receptor protein
MKIQAYLRLVGTCTLLANTVVSGANAAEPDVVKDDAAAETVIVTGTRDTGKKIRESMTPVIVIGADDLAATGQTTVLDALKNLVPSLNTPAVGYDVGALARTFNCAV